MRHPVALVAALGRNRVIGREGAMPWHLGSDLRRFRALTTGKPMIMGRKTWESIGRPLPGRTTIVVTRRGDLALPEGVLVAGDLTGALERAGEIAARDGAEAVMVVGGGEIYAAAMPFADRLHLTEVEAEPPGDAVFPPVDPALWREVGREAHPAGPKDDHAFAFVDYLRRAS